MITFKPIVRGSEIAGRQPKVEVEDETRPILLMALLFASGASPEIFFLGFASCDGGRAEKRKRWSSAIIETLESLCIGELRGSILKQTLFDLHGQSDGCS